MVPLPRWASLPQGDHPTQWGPPLPRGPFSFAAASHSPVFPVTNLVMLIYVRSEYNVNYITSLIIKALYKDKDE